MKEEIRRWRDQIDDLDLRIRDLLNERSRCALAIGAVKKRANQPVYDPGREAEIVGRVLEGNGGPLPDEALRRLFERILDESRRLERTSSTPTNSDDAEEKG
ncbi:MAG: chorismate mutase [Acidobacteriota bacterium]